MYRNADAIVPKMTQKERIFMSQKNVSGLLFVDHRK